MTTTIYFTRHGEVFNPKEIYYLRLPKFHLSEKGEKEIAETAKFLEKKHIAELYASPLLRAQQTANIIQKQLSISKTHISKQLLEIRTSYQGKLLSELDPLQSEVYLKPLRKTDETMTDIGERMSAFVRNIVTKHPGKKLVASSHGDPIMILYAIINKIPLNPQSVKAHGYIKHGEVFELSDYDGQQTMRSIFIPKVEFQPSKR